MRGSELISVVIPTKNGADTLPELLAGLFAQRIDAELEVAVVDSGSSDDTLAILEQHPVQIHRIPPHEFNHGGTRNYGIARTRGEYVALLTQDAIPATTELLAKLVAPFENPQVAGVYGRQIPRSDCDVIRRRELEGWLTGRTEADLSQLEDAKLSDLQPSERHLACVFDNVCSALRRSIWEKHPFPLTDFGEDIEWGKQVLEAGCAIAYEPGAAVIHSHRRSVRYEYQRTRICHRRLHDLFGLETVPTWRDAVRNGMWNLRHDLPYVLEHAPSGAERWRQLVRTAGISLASPLAQYHGARDARRGERG